MDDYGVGRRPIQPVAPLLATLTSGGLGFLADYPHPLPGLLIVAPLPALVVALRGSPGRAAVIGAGVGFLERADLWRAFIDRHDGLPVGLVIGMAIGMAVMSGGSYALATAMAQRIPAWTAALVWPALVVLAEYGAAHGPGLWFVPSATLAAAPWLLPLAAFGGTHVLTLCALLVPSGFAVAWVKHAPSALLAPAAAASLILASLALEPPRPSDVVRVAALSLRVPPEIDARWRRREVRSTETLEVLRRLEELAGRAAAAGARVIVWPEYALYVTAADRALLAERVSALARETGAMLVGGWIDVDNAENRALLAAPDGRIAGYVKRCLKPGDESSWLVAGQRPYASLAWNGLTVATNVCCDLDYPAGAAAAGAAGIHVLAVPAMDWPGIVERHAGQAVLRSAENRMAMVRATRNGRSLVVAPSGEVVASASDATQPELLLVADLPVVRSGTPAATASHLVVAACALIVAGAVLRLRSATQDIWSRF